MHLHDFADCLQITDDCLNVFRRLRVGYALLQRTDDCVNRFTDTAIRQRCFR